MNIDSRRGARACAPTHVPHSNENRYNSFLCIYTLVKITFIHFQNTVDYLLLLNIFV